MRTRVEAHIQEVAVNTFGEVVHSPGEARILGLIDTREAVSQIRVGVVHIPGDARTLEEVDIREGMVRILGVVVEPLDAQVHYLEVEVHILDAGGRVEVQPGGESWKDLVECEWKEMEFVRE